MAITLFGTASTPSDNGTNTTNPTVVTPPGSMVAGQLVYLIACGANTSGDVTLDGNQGGQSWTALTQRNTTRHRVRCFHCVFNGTWTANPSVAMPGTANNIVRMLVFSPSSGATFDSGSLHVAEASATYAAPTTPFEVTVPSVTVTAAGTLIIATWTSADDNTWGARDNSLFTDVSPAQVRNTSGTYDQSVANSYAVMPTATDSDPVVRIQTALAGDAGTRYSIAFREYRKLAGSAASTSGANASGTVVFALSAAGSAVAQSSAVANGNKLKFVTGSAAATSTATAGAINADKIYSFYNWLVGSPAIGVVAGPDVVDGVHITEVSSYVTSGTSAAFNIKERTTPESGGTNVLSGSQVADADGTSTTTIDNPDIAAGNTLVLDITAVTDAPAILSVTATYYKRIARTVDVAGRAIASSSAVAKIGDILRTVKGAVTSAATAFARATCTFLLAGSVAAASSAVGGVSGIAIVSVSGSAACTSSAVGSAGTGKIYTIFNWLVGSPAVGGIAGPKLPQGFTVVEVSSYVTSATSATFNVEERTSPESAGTNLLASDQAADADGTTTSTIDNSALAKDSWLYLDISAIDGTPAILSVTVTCLREVTTLGAGTSSGASSAVANATVLGAPKGSSAGSSSATATICVLRTAAGSASSTSSAVGVTDRIVENIVKFYNWLVGSPVGGFVAGPRLVEGATITEVSGYIIGGTQASFNLQERTTPETATAALITSDLSVTTTGASTTTFDDATLGNGNTLVLDIRSVDGSPTILSVTVFYTTSQAVKGRVTETSSATANAIIVKSASGSAGSVFSTTGDFVRARYVVAAAASSGTAGAGARVGVFYAGAGSSAGTSTAVAKPTLVPPGSGTASATSSAVASASVLKTVRGSASATSTATLGGLGIVEVRGHATSTSSAVAFADYKDRAFGHVTAVSTAKAKARLSNEGDVVGHSAGASTAKAKLSYYPGVFVGHSNGTTTSTGKVLVYGPASLWVKVDGEWRLAASGGSSATYGQDLSPSSDVTFADLIVTGDLTVDGTFDMGTW